MARRNPRARPQSVRALRLTWYRNVRDKDGPRYSADIPEGWLVVRPVLDWVSFTVNRYGRPAPLGWTFMTSVSAVESWAVATNQPRARMAMMEAERFIMRWRDEQVRAWGGRVVDGPPPEPILAGASRPRAIALMDDDDE